MHIPTTNTSMRMKYYNKVNKAMETHHPKITKNTGQGDVCVGVSYKGNVQKKIFHMAMSLKNTNKTKNVVPNNALLQNLSLGYSVQNWLYGIWFTASTVSRPISFVPVVDDTSMK